MSCGPRNGCTWRARAHGNPAARAEQPSALRRAEQRAFVRERDDELSARVRMQRRGIARTLHVRLIRAELMPGEIRLHRLIAERLRAVREHVVERLEVLEQAVDLLGRE